MKRVVLFCCLLLAACSKKQSFNYNLGSVNSFTLQNNSTAQWKIPVSRTAGGDELVVVTLGTLPKGVSVLSPSVTTRSGDTAVFTLTSLLAMTGNYSVSISSTSSSSVTKSYAAVLSITQSGDCSSLFAGEHIARHAMLDSFNAYNSAGFETDYVEEIIPEFANKIKIKRMGALRSILSTQKTLDVFAFWNCDYGTFDIPVQATGMSSHSLDSIVGIGQYEDGRIIINYKVLQWGGPGVVGTPRWIRHVDTLQL